MSQKSHPYRTNRDLFSNHYLTEHLRQTEPWQEVDQDEVRDTYNEIQELWDEKKHRVEDYNESSLEENFIRPMFDILGIPFEVEQTVKRNARRPDYGFFPSVEAADTAYDRDDFYEEAVAVADAKRWERKLDTRGEEKRDFENPSYQIHAYLQETPVQWAVLTNGKQWRLYYGPTSHRLDSYYEIDLPGILQYVEEDGGLDDFKDFYLFFRQRAFLPDQSGDCFLDDVYDESSVFAEAIGEDLQENIYDAIRVLAEGFLDTNEDLGEDDLPLIHDSSLIYLYRIIFVLYAESEGRDLLPTDNDIYSESYGLNELKREVADKRDDTQQHYQTWQTNLWDTLKELFVLIDQGSQGKNIPKDQLYIPAYNGGLFRTNPDPDDSEEARFLSTHEADDAHLAEVLDLLTRRDADEGDGQVFVDYSSLDERHLGSIYEGLLEYKLDIADEPLAVEDGEYSPADNGDEVAVTEGEVYLRTDAGERKATGSYYTPEYVVEYIVNETLGPLVGEIREDLLAQDPFGKDGGGKFAKDFAEQVFDLKVLDPAMGSGHFLVNAVDYLAREIIDAQERQDQQAVKRGDEAAISDPRTEEGELRDINWARRKVAQRCIYGVDLNPLATELAKVSLWLRTLAAEQPLAFLDHHLKTGNSLIGSDIEDVLSNGDNGDQSGQTQLSDWMNQTRQRALEHVMERFTDLLSIDNETLEDIKEMEEVYEGVRKDQLYQQLLAMANVHTASEFGLDVPEDAEEQMAAALRDGSWEDIQNKDWFHSAEAMAEEESFFHWELEFPVAFYGSDGERLEDAGFDAVIGNPPYVVYAEEQEGRESDFRIYEEVPSKTLDYIRSNYPSTTEYAPNLFAVMTEHSLEITRAGGQFGFIYPSSILYYYHFKGLREYITNQKSIQAILRIDDVFKGVETGGNAILTVENQEPTEVHTRISHIETPEEDAEFNTVSQSVFTTIPWIRWPTDVSLISVMEKVHKGTRELEEVGSFYQGVCTGNNSKWIQDTADHALAEEVLRGRDIHEFHIDWAGKYLIFDKEEMWSNTNEELLRANPKILLRQTGDSLIAALDEDGYLIIDSLYLFKPNGEYNNSVLTALFNSTLLNTLYQFYCPEMDRAFAQVKVVNLRSLPIPAINFETTQTRRRQLAQKCMDSIEHELMTKPSQIDALEKLDESKTKDVEYQLISHLVDKVQCWKQRHAGLNTDLLDYLGNYTEGQNLPDIGLFQPTSSNILDATTDEYEKLQVENVRTVSNGHNVTIEATARYKPETKDDFDTDTWGYTETDYFEAFTLANLTEEEAALVETFVPVAIEEEIGGFRDNATKTNSLIDRLKAITLPDINDVKDDLERYIENKQHAEELDEKIKKIDRLIDEIVYDLYDLTEQEIEIVEKGVTE